MFNLPVDVKEEQSRVRLNMAKQNNKMILNSGTAMSSIPAGNSTESTISIDKFNTDSFNHESKRLSRKKLKHVQLLLENKLNSKSATTINLYVFFFYY
jgi:hypothetical protein